MSDLTYRRQEAIDVLLRLMGCTDAKGRRCEHTAAIVAFGEAINETLFEMLDERVFGVLSELGLRPLPIQTHFRPGATGHREGKLR